MHPTRRHPGSTTRARYAALLAGATMLLAACSHDAMLLESDVPVPSGMSTVRSADIRRSGGTVSGGRFILAGPVDDAGALMTATRERFAGNGWTTVEIKDGLDHAEGIFTKNGRRARLTIDRRALEPDMSSGALEIGPAGSEKGTREGTGESAGDGASGDGTASKPAG